MTCINGSSAHGTAGEFLDGPDMNRLPELMKAVAAAMGDHPS